MRFRIPSILAVAAVAVALGCSLFDRTTNPTTINNSQIVNAGSGSGASPSPSSGNATLCGIPIQTVQVSGPNTFAHGTPQNYSATPLDQAGNDITGECSAPFTATFTLTGVLSGTGSSVGPATVAVNPSQAGSGNVSASILGVQSQAITVAVS